MTTKAEKAAALRIAVEHVRKHSRTVGETGSAYFMECEAKRLESEHLRETALPMDRITKLGAGHDRALFGPDKEGHYWTRTDWQVVRDSDRVAHIPGARESMGMTLVRVEV